MLASWFVYNGASLTFQYAGSTTRVPFARRWVRTDLEFRLAGSMQFPIARERAIEALQM